jgi:hypothetical protein
VWDLTLIVMKSCSLLRRPGRPQEVHGRPEDHLALVAPAREATATTAAAAAAAAARPGHRRRARMLTAAAVPPPPSLLPPSTAAGGSAPPCAAAVGLGPWGALVHGGPGLPPPQAAAHQAGERPRPPPRHTATLPLLLPLPLAAGASLPCEEQLSPGGRGSARGTSSCRALEAPSASFFADQSFAALNVGMDSPASARWVGSPNPPQRAPPALRSNLVGPDIGRSSFRSRSATAALRKLRTADLRVSEWANGSGDASASTGVSPPLLSPPKSQPRGLFRRGEPAPEVTAMPRPYTPNVRWIEGRR